MKMGRDDETGTDNGMTMMLQHESGQIHLKMLTRSDVHLLTIVSSLEDGRYNTLFIRVFLTR